RPASRSVDGDDRGGRGGHARRCGCDGGESARVGRRLNRPRFGGIRGVGNSRPARRVDPGVTDAQSTEPSTTPADTPASDDRIVDLEVWADIACPWCYIGATRLARALKEFDRSDRVRVQWRAFELNPDAEAGTGRREID